MASTHESRTITKRKAEDRKIPNADVVQFGKAMRLARVKAGIHQKAIAYHMGWHPTGVSQLETGDRASVPDLDVVQRLDDFLDADGDLVEAAGYKVTRNGRRKEVERTLVLPEKLTKSEHEILKGVVSLILEARKAEQGS